MSISSISQFIASQQTELQKTNLRSRDALEKIAQKAEQSILGETGSITNTQELQSKASSFRKAAANATQAGDILKVAGAALVKIEAKLSAFQQKISPTAEDIVQLGKEVDAIVQGTTFGGKELLDGTFSNKEGVDVALPTLSGLDVGSQEKVAEALNFVTQQRQSLSDQQDNVDIVATVFEVSAQNQEASQATFPSADELSLIEQVVSQQQSVYAQTNRLQANILNLIQS